MAQRYQRITVAFDEETYGLFESLHKEMKTSQSDALRRMVRHYAESPPSEDSHQRERTKLYSELLDGGEHVILDIDHLSVLLRAVGAPTQELREALRAVALSHADQWKSRPPGPRELLERLEACNFFKVGHADRNQFTLLPSSEPLRPFVRWVVADFLAALGYRTEVKEDLAKLRVKILD